MSKQLLISLEISQFRNLQPVTLTFSPNLNLFTGSNAAGKTSILESLYVLARAKSFRTSSLDKLIQAKTSQFQLVAKVQMENNKTIPIGLLRKNRQLIARINGQQVRRLSELATFFPMHWLGGNLHQLVEEGPAYRRQFLDWGVFHVKHDYMSTWKRFQRILKQRNAALRSGKRSRDVLVWDGEFCSAGEHLHSLRKEYFDIFSDELNRILPELLDIAGDFRIRYSKGWLKDLSLKESLRESLAMDKERGFTRIGPQRADLELRLDDRLAKDCLSRGQQKLLVIALQLTQAQILKKIEDRNSLFLLDDLGAELDPTNQKRVMCLLRAIDAQVFATAIKDPLDSGSNEIVIRKFHVKHGVISEVVL